MKFGGVLLGYGSRPADILNDHTALEKPHILWLIARRSNCEQRQKKAGDHRSPAMQSVTETLLVRGLERTRLLQHFPGGIFTMLLGVEDAPAIVEGARTLAPKGRPRSLCHPRLDA